MRALRLPPDATDAEIAESLAQLPLSRLEAITRLLLARLDGEARQRLSMAAMALPGVVGATVERATQELIASALRPRPRAGRS